MNNKKTQLITLGLLIAGAATFGIISVGEQLITTPNTASATNHSSVAANDEENTVIEEMQQQKELDTKETQTQPDQQQEVETQETQEEQIQPIATDDQPEATVIDYPIQEEDVSTQQYAEPQEQPVAASAPAQQEQTTPQAASMTLSIAGTNIPYQNGGASGQAVIDANPYGMASTFGGASVQSGSDNMNTHFIGHNPGIFASVFNLGSGSQITVTDANGTPTVYTVAQIIQVDDYGFGINDNIDYYDTIIGSGSGERITLQTCITDTENLIVIAYA